MGSHFTHRDFNHDLILMGKRCTCVSLMTDLDIVFICKDVALRWRRIGRDSVSNHQPNDCLLNCLFRHRSKKTSKLRYTGLCAGNSPGTHRASYAENVSIWWRHHGKFPIRFSSRDGSPWPPPLTSPRWTVVYFIKEMNPGLDKPSSNFNGGVPKLGLTSSVK